MREKAGAAERRPPLWLEGDQLSLVCSPRMTMVMAPSRTAVSVLQVRVKVVSSGTMAMKELEPDTPTLALATRS